MTQEIQLSVREQIIRKVLEVLEPVALEYGARVMRSPTLAITRDECPAIVVFPERTTAKTSNMVVERTLVLRVAGVVREVLDDDAMALADTLVVASHKALVAQRSLGGLCQKFVEIDCDLEVEDADATLAVAQASFQIDFKTWASNPGESAATR